MLNFTKKKWKHKTMKARKTKMSMRTQNINACFYIKQNKHNTFYKHHSKHKKRKHKHKKDYFGNWQLLKTQLLNSNEFSPSLPSLL